jgi:hypothetical protein
VITQLRDVRAAGESTEVAVEHQQQPVAAVVFETAGVAGAVQKGEGDGRLAGEVFHMGLLIFVTGYNLVYYVVESLLFGISIRVTNRNHQG